MQPTKTEWAIVEEKLGYMHEPVALTCDGYHVMFNLQRISAMKNAICVYVGGKMKIYPEDCEERRRFHWPAKRSVMSAKEKRELLKEPKWLQKRLAAESRLFNPKATYTIYKPWWGSFKALKAHLVTNNESIELLKTWKYEPRKAEVDGQ